MSNYAEGQALLPPPNPFVVMAEVVDQSHGVAAQEQLVIVANVRRGRGRPKRINRPSNTYRHRGEDRVRVRQFTTRNTWSKSSADVALKMLFDQGKSAQ